MKRILVVGLTVVLGAAAGNAGTVGTNGGKGDQSSTSTTTTSNTSSSGNGTSHPAAVAPSNASVRAPVAHYPGNVRVPASLPASLPANVYPNGRIQRRFLDRSEILARQGVYLNQNRVSSASVDANTQNPAGTGQLRGRGQIDTPDQALGRTRRHRGDQNGSPDNDGANGTNATNGTGGKH